jgi:hypothetical protein
MARERNCVECGHPLQMYSGVTINGAAYHDHCWDKVVERFQRAPASSPRGVRPRVMPAVDRLQLGR